MEWRIVPIPRINNEARRDDCKPSNVPESNMSMMRHLRYVRLLSTSTGTSVKMIKMIKRIVWILETLRRVPWSDFARWRSSALMTKTLDGDIH